MTNPVMLILRYLQKKKKMDIGAALIRLKPNQLQQVDDWQQQLKQRQHEVLAALKAQGVRVESWFSLQLEDQDYLLAYMRAEDIHQAQQISKTNPHAIDQFHQKFKHSWEAVYPAQLLIDFELSDE